MTRDPGCRLCAHAAGNGTLGFADGDLAAEGTREALLTLGNGCLATRGAKPEAHADGIHYPGTYVVGVYNRLVSRVRGQELEDESLVNMPAWPLVTFWPTGKPGRPRARSALEAAAAPAVEQVTSPVLVEFDPAGTDLPSR